MCFSFLNLLRGIKELGASLTDTKDNLSDIKSILEGALKITEDIEKVSEQVDNLVSFYANESKISLREQLSTTMTMEGREKLSNKDFILAYKTKFENEISRIIECNSSKQARVTILNIIKQQKRSVDGLKLKFEETSYKLTTLHEVEKYLTESLLLYNRGYANFNLENNLTLDETATSNNIKAFCDEQRIIEQLEELLKAYYLSEIEDAGYHRNAFESESLKFRDRATRVRKFRKYLKSRIKLKKIGSMYKEEINIPVNVDLKKVSDQIWDIEKNLNKQCMEVIEVLRQLPRQRFADVLKQEYTFNLSDIIQELRSPFRGTDHDVTLIPDFDPNLHTSGEENFANLSNCTVIECLQISDEKIQRLPYLTKSHKVIFKNKERSQDSEKIAKEELKFIDSADITFSEDEKCRNEEAIIVSRNIKTRSQKSKETLFKKSSNKEKVALMRNLTEEKPFDALKKEKEKVSYHVNISNSFDDVDIYKSTIFNKTIVIDPSLIYHDFENMLSPVFDAIARKSFHYAIESIDKSHVFLSHIIDIATNIEHLINSSAKENGARNIFIDNFIDACTVDLSEEGRIMMKKLVHAILFSKESRKHLCRSLEHKLPSIMGNVLKNYAGMIEEIKLKKNNT